MKKLGEQKSSNIQVTSYGEDGEIKEYMETNNKEGYRETE